MQQAKSQVQVSITAQLGQGFSAAFQNADKRMQALGRTAQDLSKKVGDIAAYRRQQNALKEAATAFNQAKQKAAALRAEIAASEAPTRKQAAALAAAERAAARAGGAYTQARTKLADMSRELQKGGVNVAKLSTEYKRLQSEVGKATSAMAKQEKSLQRQAALVNGMAKTWRGMQAGIAGGAAAAAVLAQPAKKALTYDEQLARLSDTAVAGGGSYKASKVALSGAVQDALRAAGGGTREDVIGGLSTLIASGGRSVEEATKDIVPIARAAFASKTSADQIAQLVLKMKGFGVTDTGAGLDVLYRSGQKGGVELADMARYLPEQLASARSAGYSGTRGLAEIGAMNQVGLATAGSAEQAANNVTNLLNKLSSPELSKNIQKVTGVNFDQYALKNQQKGIYKAESFAMLADQQMTKDPRYMKLKKELESAKTKEDRAAKVNEMAAMLEGSAMGQFIQDRQALAQALAMVAARKSGELGAQRDYALNGTGGVNQTLGNLGGETFATVQNSKSMIDLANERTFENLSGAINGTLLAFNKFAEAFPGLTTAAYGAALALGAVAAAGVVGGFVRRGGAAAAAGAAAGSVGTTAATIAGGAAAGGLASKIAGGGGNLLKGGVIAGAGGYAIDAAAGALGAGGNKISQQQDDANWDKMSFGQKAMSSIPRGIEKIGSLLFLDNLVNSAQSSRIASETEMVAKKAAEAASAATAAQAKLNMTFNNSYSVQVTAPPQAGYVELKAQMEQALREAQKKAERDQRSLMTDKLGY